MNDLYKSNGETSEALFIPCSINLECFLMKTVESIVSYSNHALVSELKTFVLLFLFHSI